MNDPTTGDRRDLGQVRAAEAAAVRLRIAWTSARRGRRSGRILDRERMIQLRTAWRAQERAEAELAEMKTIATERSEASAKAEATIARIRRELAEYETGDAGPIFTLGNIRRTLNRHPRNQP